MHSEDEKLIRRLARRRFIAGAAAGSVIPVLGGAYVFAELERTAKAKEEKLPDGRPRLPPGQKLLTRLKPMGGAPGSPSKADFKLRVHGLVENELNLDFREFMAVTQVEQEVDVHCVTGWSVLGSRWIGVRISELAKRAKVKADARHVIFEAAHGYTANVRLDEALHPQAMLAHRLDGRPLSLTNGAPVRGVVPNLYFWKSAKWITGIRFVKRDRPGYWERRGYHNHADPWLEERFS